LRQLCEVLDYLHCNNPPIIHTDIKPANIIVRDNGDICLIDFGISLSADDAVKGYSKNYSSPEQYMNVMNILNGTPEFNAPLDGRTDIYSLGAAYYHLMTGCIPDIEDETLPPLEEYELPYSQPFVSIISKAMEWDIKKRYKSAAKMLSAVDNIKKQDERYKRYILLQVLSSVVSGIMIVSGVLMFVFGNYEIAGTELAGQYDLFVSYCDKGDTVNAERLGTDLLNNSKYRSVMTDKTT
ncbi:MAG TPA: protein kinase, partial [Ruminococcus bromii]